MKNIMEIYLNFTEKKIKRYIKMIYCTISIDNIIDEFIKTYINARYYNICNTDKPARAFYLRILDEIEIKSKNLISKIEKEEIDYEEKEKNIKFINNLNQVFQYLLFFDNVRKIDNFKNLDSLREIIQKIYEILSLDYNVKRSKKDEDELYTEVTKDLLDKDLFIEKYEPQYFSLELSNCEEKENLYYAKLNHNIKMPTQFSELALEKVYTEGIVAEDKLLVEYTILSKICLTDVIEGNFKDSYIAEFAGTLLEKKTKIETLLSIIENQALQEKIHIRLDYSDYMKHQKQILTYINKGFDFAIFLDGQVRNIEQIKELKIFKIVIAPRRLAICKEIEKNKETLKNVILK